MSANEFFNWREKHVAEGKCSSNYEGPSTEMERFAVHDMFSKSLDYNLMYRYLVGDGDSKSFLDVWDIYGACDHCHRVSSIINKRSSKEYEEWIKTEDYKKYTASHYDNSSSCFAVQKIDCIQHVEKCFGAKLELIVKFSLRASDGKSWNMGNYRLGKKARTKLQKYFTKCIKHHAKSGILSTAEQDEGAAE